MNKAIKKIELDLGGKTVSLTPQQAENLKDALDELFGVTVVWKEPEKVYIPVPNTYPRPQPWVWEWQRDPYYLTTSGVSCDYVSNTETLRLTG